MRVGNSGVGIVWANNKRITNCLVDLYGKTKPTKSLYSSPLRVGLYVDFLGFILPYRPTKQLVIPY